MKKLLLILFVALLQSCATVYHEAVYSIDFRDYVEKGFMISPTDTGFDYTPLTQLEVDFYIGKIVTDEDKDGLEKGVGGYYPTSKRMMDKVVDKAKMLGADGIVCFKVQYFPQTKYSQAFYQATGVAVKVKK